MTVGDLLAALQGFDEGTEVRLAMQPSWPFEYSISEVIPVNLKDDEDDEDDETEPDVVYLVEGTQLGYLPQKATEEIGW